MNSDSYIERLFPALTSGDRIASREIIRELFDEGCTAEDIAHEIYWPTLESLVNLFRSDQLSMLAHHYATRLLRMLVNQAQPHYQRGPSRDRSLLMFCGPGEADELTGQLVADLAEADGYTVHFAGGGVRNDDILRELTERKPDVLLMFASAPADAPNIRQLIDIVRFAGGGASASSEGANAVVEVQVVVGGGVFNRAEGLAEEIGADVWARTPQELLHRLVTQQARRATEDQRTVGRNRKALRAEAA